MPRPENVSTLTHGEREVELLATDDECLRLVTRMGVPAIRSFDASIRLSRKTNGLLEVDGTLRSKMTLLCAVTNQPFDTDLTAEFNRIFSQTADQVIEDADPMAEDIEPLEGDILDLGELVSEELALAIPAFPRSAQADKHLENHQGPGPDPTSSPFHQLSSLAGKLS